MVECELFSSSIDTADGISLKNKLGLVSSFMAHLTKFQPNTQHLVNFWAQNSHFQRQIPQSKQKIWRLHLV